MARLLPFKDNYMSGHDGGSTAGLGGREEERRGLGPCISASQPSSRGLGQACAWEPSLPRDSKLQLKTRPPK